MDTSPSALIDVYNRMRSDASGFMALWNDVGRMCLTRKVDALTSAVNQSANSASSFTPYDSAIINSAAVDAVTVNAAGCVSWITPSDSKWFSFKPIREFQRDPVETWLAECTDIAHIYLSASNFYTKVHELFIDRVVTGTAVMTCEDGGSKKPLVFRVFDPGSFMVADNADGDSDMLFRERQMTARQAVEKFGENAVSAKVRQDATSKPQNLHRFLQAVFHGR